MKALFSEVLLKCSELGLIRGDLFAIDGCKLPSNVSKEWSGTMEELKQKKKSMEALAEKIVEQHALLDKQKDEDERFNPTCHSLVYDEEKYKRHIERIEEKPRYIDEFLKTAEPRTGASGGEVKSNITDSEELIR
jgi:hypothetical protein